MSSYLGRVLNVKLGCVQVTENFSMIGDFTFKGKRFVIITVLFVHADYDERILESRSSELLLRNIISDISEGRQLQV